jgi:hypothetical protein
LWLLARAPTVSEEVRSAFIAKALGQGFDTSKLIYGRHTEQKPSSAPPETWPGAFGEAATSSVTASATSSAAPAADTPLPTDYDRVATPAGHKQS